MSDDNMNPMGDQSTPMDGNPTPADTPMDTPAEGSPAEPAAAPMGDNPQEPAM